MKYAEVSVNSPAAQRRTFSYSVPDRLEVNPGHAVLVPFGEKELQGVVLELSPQPAVEDTREILDIIEPEPVLSSIHIGLARWISDYYLSPLFDAVAMMLPPGFERRAVTSVNLVHPPTDTSTLSDDQQRTIDLVAGGTTAMRVLERKLGKKKAQAIVTQLVRQGLFSRTYELAPVRVRPRQELYINLKQDNADLSDLTSRQSALIAFIKDKPGPVAWAVVRHETGITKDVVNALVRRGLLATSQVEVSREPISYEGIAPSVPLALNSDQQSAFSSVAAALAHAGGKNRLPETFLLHGVTGSGKTEIYLQSLAEAIRLGKRGIVLVPEIALTPQTIERFAARFSRRVAILHSKLSLGEQYDEWRRIRRGEFDVVIGSRSAIFAPQPDLGLIIIDEEHEWTYKQDISPRYHARAVAEKLAGLTGAVLVLGSATPGVESYFRAQNGDYKLLRLPGRVVPVNGAALPQVEVVDMRQELKAGNRDIFSRSLARAINLAVAGGEQIILFLNRRGGATFIQCRRCGFVLRCRRCDVPLSQHPSENILTCHQCNYRASVPTVCPSCGSPQLKFLGAGTQKLEQEVKYQFPRARQLRWDSDITTGKNSHETILKKFRDRQAEILVGTQMVAKGLDIPSVTLVGVVSADTSLNLPDFRAGERTFQLLSQVAGRAGRGVAGGRVIIQTFSPEHYAIKAAARHDYASFYEQELAYRRMFHNPPFTRLARLTYAHASDARCQEEAERLKKVVATEIDALGLAGIEILGPAPAFIRRLRGRYRWQLILRGRDLAAFLAPLDLPRGWAIDIDPVNLVQ
ncbi:MAG: primosomal protein N' [Chloroflexi bacterium RBG_16_56_11]|nr:MAG: primosomal protein N' [Chloroflexi bacterium RBG_16_56_11]